jgi:L-aspartate semialdehyde sulfurtransferase ferredoxin
VTRLSTAWRGSRMARLRVKFTFPPDQIKEPVIWEVGKRFDLVTNIRRADITAEVAWATLELEGEQTNLEQGIRWVAEKGVRVDPVEDTIIEG